MDSVQRRLPHRNPALLSREVDGEFVVVDEAANAAHQLTGPVAEVWRAIEGGVAPSLPDAKVDEIVGELSQVGLLVEPKGMTRRAMLQRTGVVVAATGLTTIALPAAVAHASSGVTVVVTLTAVPSPVDGGSTITISGTVKRQAGTGNPVTGTVTLLIDSKTAGSAVPVVDGTFTFSGVTAPYDNFTVAASYGGSTDKQYAPAVSSNTTVTVNAVNAVLTTVVAANKSGGTAQLLETGDSLVLTFDKPLSTASVTATATATPSGFSIQWQNSQTRFQTGQFANITASGFGTGNYTFAMTPSLSNGNKTLTLLLGGKTGNGTPGSGTTTSATFTVAGTTTLKGSGGGTVSGSAIATNLF